MPARKKVREEVAKPVTGEQVPPTTDPSNDTTVVDPDGTPEDTTPAIRSKGGVVLLRYTGESPVKAVKNVPSGATYKINAQGLVAVYAQDAAFLLKKKDFAQA